MELLRAPRSTQASRNASLLSWRGRFISSSPSVASVEALVGRRREQLPNAFYPVEMLGLHEYGAQANEGFAIGLHRSQMLLPKTNRQFRYRQMQIALRRRFEYLAAHNRRLAGTRGFRRKYDNVEFR